MFYPDLEDVLVRPRKGAHLDAPVRPCRNGHELFQPLHAELGIVAKEHVPEQVDAQGRWTRPPTVRLGTHVSPAHNQRGTVRRSFRLLGSLVCSNFSLALSLTLFPLSVSSIAPSTPLLLSHSLSLSLARSLSLSLALSSHIVRCATPPPCVHAHVRALSLLDSPRSPADPPLLSVFSTHMSSVNRGISALLTISAFFAPHRSYRSAREKIPCFVNSFW